uniref:Uncharacterized protein n=1 Tax=Pithovirus LCPAC401 TaxID=2506595 RepID=A0A481ZA79_9VIRU|nr:MAG: uncharacterized protein LCPAC401_04710 [Pithovirus LCPAC401]
MTDSTVKRYSLPDVDEKFDSLKDQGKRSIFALKTLHGFEFSEASSSLQKAIRRGHWKDALQWAIEMSQVPVQGRSNLFNRLYIIAVEDIGPADPKQFLIINALHKLYLEDKENVLYAATGAVSLAKAKKSRANDWAVHVYRFSQEDVKDENVENLVDEFVMNFFNKKLWETLYFAMKLMATSEKLKVKGIRVTVPIKVGIVKVQKRLCEILENDDKKEYMNLVMKRAIDRTTGPSKNKKNPCRGGEGILFFIHIMHIWMFDVEYGDEISSEPDKSLIPLIDDVMKGNILGVPDYALDIHTRRGKKMGRNLHHFIEEGSFLNDESEQWKPYSDFCLSKLMERKNGKEMRESYDDEFDLRF